MKQRSKHILYRVGRRTEQQVERQPRRSFKVFIGGSVGLVMIGALITHFLTTPSHGVETHVGGTIKKQAETKRALDPESNTESPYYTIQLPVGYKSQQLGQLDANLRYHQGFVYSAGLGRQLIVITIRDNPGNLKNLSDYQLRTTSGRFQRANQEVHGESLELYSDTQSASVLAYWVHGSYVATIAASGAVESVGDTANKDQKDALLPVLEGWHWR